MTPLSPERLEATGAQATAAAGMVGRNSRQCLLARRAAKRAQKAAQRAQGVLERSGEDADLRDRRPVVDGTVHEKRIRKGGGALDVTRPTRVSRR